MPGPLVRLCAVLALAVALAPAGVEAARPPTPRLLAQAERQVGAGDFESALITLQDALGSPDNSNEELSQIYWRMGEVYVFLKRERSAFDSFERLLYLQPDFAPPRLTSPHVRRSFEKAKEQFSASGKQVALEVPLQRAPPPNQPFGFEAQIAGLRDDMSARVYFRRALSEAWVSAELKSADPEAGTYVATLPGFPAGATLEYYVEIQGRDRRRVQGYGSTLAPRTLRIGEALAQAALVPDVPPPAPGPAAAWYRRPWVWGLVAGAAVVGGGAYYFTREPEEALLRARIVVIP